MTNIVYEPSHTTHWKNLFPSKTLLLGSHNLNEGEELVAEIADVEIKEIINTNGQKERVPVVTFVNAPPMVLNITNSRTIATLYGELYDHWIGKRVQIFATQIKAFGEVTMALRIRNVIPSDEAVTDDLEQSLRDCKTLDELRKVFMSLPKHLKPKLESVKNEMKQTLQMQEAS